MLVSRTFFLILGVGGYAAWLITFFSTTFLGAHHDQHAATKNALELTDKIRTLSHSNQKLAGENAELRDTIAKLGSQYAMAERNRTQREKTHTQSSCIPCVCPAMQKKHLNPESTTIPAASASTIVPPNTCGRPVGSKDSAPCGLNTTRGMSALRGGHLRDAFNQRGLLFLRIQKTAGTTFEQVLKSECTAAGVTCGSYWHLERNMVARNAKGRILVTWLRDPVERIASEWGYIRNAPGYQWQQPQWDFQPELQSLLHLWLHPPDSGEPLGSLKDFVAMPGNPANNRQVLYLLGFDRPDIFECDHIRTFGGTWDRWQQFYSEGGISPGRALNSILSCGTPQATLLELAKHRLEEEIDFFGLAECFNASLAMLAPQLGWNLSRTLRVASVRHRANGGDLASAGPAVPWRQRLSTEDISAIETANSLDLELYIFAKQLLQRRLSELKVNEKCS